MQQYDIVPDLDICSYNHLMSTKKAVANRGIGVDHTSGIDHRIVADRSRDLSIGIQVSQLNTGIDPGTKPQTRCQRKSALFAQP